MNLPEKGGGKPPSSLLLDPHVTAPTIRPSARRATVYIRKQVVNWAGSSTLTASFAKMPVPAAVAASAVTVQTNLPFGLQHGFFLSEASLTREPASDPETGGGSGTDM